MDAGVIVAGIFIAIFTVGLAFVAFAVIRTMWQFWRAEFEPESGGSYGRQLFGRRRRKT